jgi:DNA-binding NarL/FixJ family response regulator
VSLRVLVVDDHPMFRRGLAGLLESLPDVEVAGLAGSGEEALELAAADRPDVVLMDLNLPTISGVEATRRLGELPAPPAVLALTMLDDDATVVAALRAGARGYVLKGASGEEIAAAVRTVAAGGVVLGAGVAGHLLALTGAGPRPGIGPDALTDRERDVLELLADGLANPQIARRLGLSVKTVQNYVSRILDKLQVADRTQAALRARDRRS